MNFKTPTQFSTACPQIGDTVHPISRRCRRQAAAVVFHGQAHDASFRADAEPDFRRLRVAHHVGEHFLEGDEKLVTPPGVQRVVGRRGHLLETPGNAGKPEEPIRVEAEIARQ